MAQSKSKKKVKKSTPVKKAAKKPVKMAKAASKPKMKAAVKLTKALKKAAVLPSKSKSSKNSDWTDFLTPLDDRILVQVEVMTKTAGGLFIPSSANERPNQGKVIAVGRGHQNKKGRVRPMDVSLGDTVLFAPVAGVDMTLMDQEVLILRESDILGILES